MVIAQLPSSGEASEVDEEARLGSTPSGSMPVIETDTMTHLKPAGAGSLNMLYSVTSTPSPAIDAVR